jgi:hypothetical protein
VQDEPAGEGPSASATQRSEGVWFARADGDERLASWAEVRALKVGLISASARPDRVLRSLRRRGIVPVRVIRARDHGPVDPRFFPREHAAYAGPGAVDVWLATRKCAEHFCHERTSQGTPSEHVRGRPPTLGIIDHRLELSAALKDRLEQSAGGLRRLDRRVRRQ